MAVTLTYDDTVSRVVISASGLTGAQTATVERSTNGVQWTTVRGGSAVTVTAGAFPVPIYDYEFSPDVVNTYRVTPDRLTVLNDPFTRVAANAWGTEPVTGQTYTVQTTAGDYDVTGTAGTIEPTGSGADRSATVDVNASDVQGQAKFSINTLPASNDFDMGLVLRRTDTGNYYAAKARIAVSGAVTLVAHKRVTGPGQVDIATIASGVTMVTATQYTLKAEVDGNTPTTIRLKFWKTSDPEPAAWKLETTDVSSQPPITGDLAGAFARNNSATLSRIMTVDDMIFYNLSPAAQTGTITPAPTSVWLKSISRPFLNQAVQVIFGPTHVVTRPARVGVFDIIGRSFPIAVSDVRRSRRWTMRLLTETEQAGEELDLILASGDVLYLQGPAACPDIITGYIAVEDAVRENHPLRPTKWRWTLPCIEVAAPGPDVIGSTVTWASLIATYGSWQAVLAAQASWASSMTLIGDPGEVIVP